VALSDKTLWPGSHYNACHRLEDRDEEEEAEYSAWSVDQSTPRVRPGGVADSTGSSTGEVGEVLRRQREGDSGISCVNSFTLYTFCTTHPTAWHVGKWLLWVRAWEVD
jgi:hypothetical protein